MKRHKKTPRGVNFTPHRVWIGSSGVLATLFSALVVTAFTIAPTGAMAAAPDFLWQSPLDGEAGSGAGQLESPEAIATNPITGHVYVVDRLNLRISEFDAWGQFVKAWGWGVANGAQELQSCGPKATPPTATCQRGSEGTEPGQFGGKISNLPLGGIAVDSAGDIYVGDMANARVQKFDPEGNFLLMFGGSVDTGPKHPGNVCTAAYIAEGDSCGAGTVGEGDGQFDTPDDSPIFGNHIAVGPSGTIFIGGTGRIDEFEPDGAFKSKVMLDVEVSPSPYHPNAIFSLAIDGSGDMYVVGVENNIIFKFSPAGVNLSTITENRIEREGPLALDGEGNLYATAEFNEGGEPHREVIEFAPDGSSVLPVGKGFAKGEGTRGSGYSTSVTGLAITQVTNAGGSDVYAATSGSAGSTKIGFLSSYGPPPDKWEPPSAPPEIRSQYATSVDSEGATLQAQINPRFWADTTYYVEYGAGKCSEGGCPKLLPVPPGNQLGGGIVNASVTTTSIILKGLEQGTTYHYRFVAQSGGGGPAHGVEPGEAEGAFTTLAPSGLPSTSCPNQAFRTAASATLVDCRAYEMVSPVDKNNTDIATLINLRNNHVLLDQSAREGGALTYTTSQGFGDAQGVPYLSQYLATRTKDGWTNHGITPPRSLSRLEAGRKTEPEFRAFTADLCSGALQHSADPPLAPGGIEAVLNLYRRHNCGEEGYEALTTTAPPNLGPRPQGSFFQPDVQGFTADGSCTVFRANDQLTPDANPGTPTSGTNMQIYESCGGELHLVSVLPNGKAATTSANTGTGNQHQDGSLDSTDDQAVSADGSRVYWTTPYEGPGQLFVRVNATQEQSQVIGGKCTEEEKACTFKVSQSVSNADARFFGASKDGARAFFKVQDESSPLDGNLYEFDLESKKAALVATKVGGVMGVGGEASRIYFLSTSALAGPNPEGKAPVVGQQNLYLYERSEEEGSTRFIATLAVDDGNTSPGAEVTPVHVQPYKHTSRLTPDGRHIAFMSRASLTGYDSTDVQSGKADAEIFTYDADRDKLSCVSCNPSGVRPSGRLIKKDVVKVDQTILPGTWAAALLLPFTTELYGTRVISDDGSRIFFNSYEALLPHDTNGKADVYEWERPGAGDCTEASPVFSPPNDGCLSLISSGEGPSDSEFVDASADGTDVFFTTSSSLLPQDPGLIDIYDARAGGGYPPPPVPPASCEGEACQGPLAPPNDPTPASSAFEGAGNVKAEKKAHKKKADKKKRSKKHAAKRRKRANGKGRAGR